MTNFFVEHWVVITFYAVVALLLYLFRSKFEFQGIVALLKTSFGVDFMTKTGERWPRFWHKLGMVSIVLGFAGMLLITSLLFYGVYTLFFVPDAPPILSPVIPGVKIPGVPIDYPLFYTLGALFLAVIVHEAAHGIYSAAYKIKIKSSGFAFFGPLPGAFVEPDEKILTKRPKREQLAIFSAGPFANMILAIVAFILLFGVAALASTMVTEQGVFINKVQADTPAALAGLHENLTITYVNSKPIKNGFDLSRELGTYKPGDAVNITANGTVYPVTLAAQPTDANKPRLGIDLQTDLALKNPSMGWLFSFMLILNKLLQWTMIISLGLGIANLLPIGPIDGGRMYLMALQHYFEEKRAQQIWAKSSMALLVIVIVLVFVPILKAVF
jgi:membrane-associated protease RseP (regulator of RpoE activity)